MLWNESVEQPRSPLPHTHTHPHPQPRSPSNATNGSSDCTVLRRAPARKGQRGILRVSTSTSPTKRAPTQHDPLLPTTVLWPVVVVTGTHPSRRWPASPARLLIYPIPISASDRRLTHLHIPHNTHALYIYYTPRAVYTLAFCGVYVRHSARLCACHP
jgi:hypothetical protein